MAAAHKIRGAPGVLFPVKVWYESHSSGEFHSRITAYAWVKANSAVISYLAEESEELSIATPDLDNIFVVQIICINQTLRETLCVCPEGAGKVKGVVIGLVVLEQRWVKSEIEDHSALVAESERDIPPSREKRLFWAKAEPGTVDGDPGYIDKFAR